MSTSSRKRKFELVTSSSWQGQSETTETTEIKTKMEWTKCMFCQNDKSEKSLTPTESKKQGTSKKTFQRIEEDLRKFQEAGFSDPNLDRFCENGEAFADTCILNHAKFHQTCRNSIDNYHFERLKKNPPNVSKTPDNTKKKLQPDRHLVVPIFCDNSDGI